MVKSFGDELVVDMNIQDRGSDVVLDASIYDNKSE